MGHAVGHTVGHTVVQERAAAQPGSEWYRSMHAAAHLVVPALAAERADERRGGLVPDLIGAHGLLGPGAQINLVLGEPKLGEDLLGEVEHLRDLIRQLLGQAEDVRVVLREAAHAEEAV